MSTRPMSPIQALRDAEINGGLAWPEDGKILVYLGCPLDLPPRQRMHRETLAGSFQEAGEWLRAKAREFDAEAPAASGHRESPIVQRLFEEGIPDSIIDLRQVPLGSKIPTGS